MVVNCGTLELYTPVPIVGGCIEAMYRIGYFARYLHYSGFEYWHSDYSGLAKHTGTGAAAEHFRWLVAEKLDFE
jgi:hypothetical protein